MTTGHVSRHFSSTTLTPQSAQSVPASQLYAAVLLLPGPLSVQTPSLADRHSLVHFVAALDGVGKLNRSENCLCPQSLQSKPHAQSPCVPSPPPSSQTPSFAYTHSSLQMQVLLGPTPQSSRRRARRPPPSDGAAFLHREANSALALANNASSAASCSPHCAPN